MKETFYLSQTTAGRLEDALAQVRRSARPARVLKSDLVESLLNVALDELETKGERSAVTGRLSPKPRRRT